MLVALKKVSLSLSFLKLKKSLPLISVGFDDFSVLWPARAVQAQMSPSTKSIVSAEVDAEWLAGQPWWSVTAEPVAKVSQI